MPFDLQPTLRGSLVELRPLRPDDFDALFVVASDPLIWEQHPDKSRSTLEGFRRFFQGALDSGGAFVAFDAHTKAVIGSSRYFGYHEKQSEVEIGWTFLARSHWGGAWNGEMKELMLRHAFRFVRQVVFMIAAENFRSQRAVEKIGGVRSGTRAGPDREERLLFVLTGEAWERRQAARSPHST